MPKFIAVGEMRQQAFVQEPMAVGEQADAHSTILRGVDAGRARPRGGGTMGVLAYFGARRLEY
jgi:hypothetical protein